MRASLALALTLLAGCRTGDAVWNGGDFCTIDGTSYAPKDPNPDNACQACDPEKETMAWSPAGEGTTCGEGKKCYGGACSTCPADSVLIPAGEFDNFAPKHVKVQAFCMQRTEVTVSAYQACLEAKACAPRGTKAGCNGGSLPNHPANCLTLAEAKAYCTWLQRRLPTLDEWEYAAKRDNAGPYPWGTAAPSDANVCWSGTQERTQTCEVGSFPAGANPQGVLDLAGNVGEWADDYIYDVALGGSYQATEAYGVDWDYRFSFPSAGQHAEVGFRCVTP